MRDGGSGTEDRWRREPPATIQAAVDRAHQRFEGARIRGFVPVFVERTACDSLASQKAEPRDRLA